MRGALLVAGPAPMREERDRGRALDSLSQLRHDYDVVICEGAGSPTEINLRGTDIVNVGLARAARGIAGHRPGRCGGIAEPAARHPAWKDLGRKIVGHLGTP